MAGGGVVASDLGLLDAHSPSRNVDPATPALTVDPTVTAVSTLLIGLTVLVLGGSALLRGRAAYR